MDGRKRSRVRQKGGMFPFGTIAGSILGAAAQLLLKKCLVVKEVVSG